MTPTRVQLCSEGSGFGYFLPILLVFEFLKKTLDLIACEVFFLKLLQKCKQYWIVADFLHRTVLALCFMHVRYVYNFMIDKSHVFNLFLDCSEQ